MKREQKQARRNVTHKKAERKKKFFEEKHKEEAASDKAAKTSKTQNAKKRDFTVKLARYAEGGIGHDGDRAVVAIDPARRNGRWTLVKVRGQKAPIKWVNGSWRLVNTQKTTKKSTKKDSKKDTKKAPAAKKAVATKKK